MMSTSQKIMKQNRTSADQLKSVMRFLLKLFCGVGKHIKKFGLFYGFIAGSITTLCVLAALIWYVVLDFPVPWKITNASDPRFDAKKFEFTDYSNDHDLQQALNILLPVGTDKMFVNKILVDTARAEEIKFTGPDKFIEKTDTRYYYTYRHLRSFISEFFAMMPEGEFTWEITIVYDAHNKLKNLHVI